MTKDDLILELTKIGVDVTHDKLDKLDRYYNLLIEWNKKFNLTAITNINDVYLKHFYDSATIAKIINLKVNYKLCDIGSGAGFPGIVLKILFPNLQITLVDSLGKRVDFLNEVIRSLNLMEIKAVHARAEDFAKENRECYDLVTARAVANLNMLLEFSLPILKVSGFFIAMKSNVSDEINNLDHAMKELDCNIAKNITFNLPIEDSLRTIILFKKNKRTISKYPRKFTDIKSRPL